MHSSSPSLNPQPAGAQISLGSLVHPVMGVYFFTFFLETEHTSLGHLEHLVLVVYPEVSSSHFSSTSVVHSTTSSSTSCTSCFVQHSDSYSVLQISGPWTLQSLTRGVRHMVAVSLKAIFSYSIKQFFLKFSSTISTLSIHLFPSLPGLTPATSLKLTLSSLEPCLAPLIPRLVFEKRPEGL